MSYKWWVVSSVCLFVIGIGIGLAIPTSLDDILSEDLAALEELGAILGPFQITTALFIFIKNVSALMLSFVFSPVLLMLPILALVFNGLLLSFVSIAVVQEKSLGFLLAGILPHGVIEIPAFIMGEAAALSFGTMMIVALFKKDARGLLKSNLKQNVRYMVIAFVLLLPAAIIETYVTPLLLT
jgi:stage II sporulation protein M